MERRGVDISIFLVGLLLICVIIGLMHGCKKEVEGEKRHLSMTFFYNTENSKALAHVMGSLQSLLVSRNIGMLANTVNQFSADIMYALTVMIIEDKESFLTKEDKLSFLLILARLNQVAKEVQFKLFDLMVKSNLFYAYSSVLLGKAKKDYMAILPSFLGWMHRQKPTLGNKYAEEIALMDKAFYSAIEQNDLPSLEMLSLCGIPIDAKKASDLLINVVYDRKKSTFIPFLINRGADVNKVGPDRYTLLSKAVSYNDSMTARTLLEAGADIDLLVDETIGSARHIAQVNGNKEIEKLFDTYTLKG